MAGQGYLSYLGPAPLRVATPAPCQKVARPRIVAPAKAPPSSQGVLKKPSLAADRPSGEALKPPGTDKPNGVGLRSNGLSAQSRGAANTNSVIGEILRRSETLQRTPPGGSSATLVSSSDGQTNRAALSPPKVQIPVESQMAQSGSDSPRVSPEMLEEFFESQAGPTNYSSPGVVVPVEFIPPAPMSPVLSRATYERP